VPYQFVLTTFLIQPSRMGFGCGVCQGSDDAMSLVLEMIKRI